MIKNSLFACLIMLNSTCMFAAPAEPLDAQQVLERVDDYRNFKDKAFSFDLELISRVPDKKEKKFLMHAKVLNSHVSLVSYLEPKRERGKALLMNQLNLWFLTNSSRKPIRITPQQRLLGDASNGDVASTDFSGDYTATYSTLTSPDLSVIVLQLDAKPSSIAAYERIILFVDRDTFKPLSSEFYAKSGKKLKTAYYEEFSKLDDVGGGVQGKSQLTKIRIENNLKDGHITSMEYSNFKLEKLSIAQFQPSQIRRLIPR